MKSDNEEVDSASLEYSDHEPSMLNPDNSTVLCFGNVYPIV